VFCLAVTSKKKNEEQTSFEDSSTIISRASCPSFNYKESRIMNKTELISAIAESADLSKADAGKALEGLMKAVTDALAKGDKISLIGFGAFSVTQRSARSCRNPQTGKKMEIAAKKVAKFKPGKQLADAVNC